MTTDAEPIEKEKLNKRAIRLYRWHFATKIICSGLVFGTVSYFFSPVINSDDTGTFVEWAIYFAILLAFLIPVDWVLALLFKRETRPWHLTRRPADRNPRR